MEIVDWRYWIYPNIEFYVPVHVYWLFSKIHVYTYMIKVNKENVKRKYDFNVALSLSMQICYTYIKCVEQIYTDVRIITIFIIELSCTRITKTGIEKIKVWLFSLKIKIFVLLRYRFTILLSICWLVCTEVMCA